MAGVLASFSLSISESRPAWSSYHLDHRRRSVRRQEARWAKESQVQVCRKCCCRRLQLPAGSGLQGGAEASEPLPAESLRRQTGTTDTVRHPRSLSGACPDQPNERDSDVKKSRCNISTCPSWRLEHRRLDFRRSRPAPWMDQCSAYQCNVKNSCSSLHGRHLQALHVQFKLLKGEQHFNKEEICPDLLLSQLTFSNCSTTVTQWAASGGVEVWPVRPA